MAASGVIGVDDEGLHALSALFGTGLWAVLAHLESVA
jgi:hypothetical protein